METKLYTAGYEGRGLDELVNFLTENGINLVADIRAVPYSRKREFSKKALERQLADGRIEYVHLGSLGSPKELRDKVRNDDDYDFFFVRYNEYLQTQNTALITLLELIREKTVCLLCYEKDVNRCHRRAVADRVAAMTDGKIEIFHL